MKVRQILPLFFNSDMLSLSSSPGPRCASWLAVERTLLRASWPLKPGRSSRSTTIPYRKTSDDTYKKVPTQKTSEDQRACGSHRLKNYFRH